MDTSSHFLKIQNVISPVFHSFTVAFSTQKDIHPDINPTRGAYAFELNQEALCRFTAAG